MFIGCYISWFDAYLCQMFNAPRCKDTQKIRVTIFFCEFKPKSLMRFVVQMSSQKHWSVEPYVGNSIDRHFTLFVNMHH